MSVPTTEWITRLPSPRLAAFVDHYVGYRLQGFPPGLHRGLPSRHMTLIVSIGPGIEVVDRPDGRRIGERFGCVVAGLQAMPTLVVHDGNQEGVAIELTPLGSRALLGFPASELWERSLELADAVGRAGVELWERLQAPSTWERRFAICDQVLTGLLGQRRVPETLFNSWEILVSSGGAISVAELAATVGWSRQHLTRRFRTEFGAGPKLAARIVRFERAWTLLRSTPSLPLTDVALTCGYFDQAHLDRDFSRLAGCPPSRLLVEEVPFFQDEEGDPSRQ